jgi:hypothetical protein
MKKKTLLPKNEGVPLSHPIDEARDTATIPPYAKKPVRTVRDAKKMLAKLIHGFQLKQIDGDDSKTMTYMIVSFVNICRDNDLEQRLRDLENKVGIK